MANPQSTSGHSRTYVIILAVCMIVLGILLAIWPMSTGYAIMVVACIAFSAFGVAQVIGYLRTPREVRNGWTLANGIVYIILGFLLLAENGTAMYITYAYLLGFIALYTGIMECAASAALRGTGSGGWMLLSAILNFILAVFLFVAPFAATWALEYVLGIYLIVGGIALLIESRSHHSAGTI